MKIIFIIEDLFAKLYTKLSELLLSLYKKVAPQKFQDKIIQTDKKIHQAKEQGLLTINKKAHQAGEQLKKVANEVKKFKLQEKMDAKSALIKENLLHLKSQGAKKNFEIANHKLKSKSLHFFKWFTQPQIKVYFSLSLILGVLGYLTYGEVNKFLNQSGIRKPASIPFEPEAVRPNYYKMEEKLYPVYNVILPIFIESKRSMTSVKLDMTIRTSNRQSILYLMKNESEIRDYMHTKLEPMVPTFPIEAEGRAILKQKLADELNNLFEEDGVEGRVEEIYLKEILGG